MSIENIIILGMLIVDMLGRCPAPRIDQPGGQLWEAETTWKRRQAQPGD